MARRRKKSSESKKKDLVREVNKETEEKWKGLENKVWTVAEFGFYIVLVAFTIFAIGYASPSLIHRGNGYIVDPGSKQISAYSTYYDLKKGCDNIRTCTIDSTSTFNGKDVDVYYTVENGEGLLVIGDLNLNVNIISEFALLGNGYVATFTETDDDNLISYYNAEGALVKEYKTKLSSNGKLNSDVGIYAVCNGTRLDTVKYTVQDDGTFFEELIGSTYSNQC